jgi:hypothetical protein
MTLDQFNSIFPVAASLAIMLNIHRLYKDKIVKGIHWASPLVSYSGQISGFILLLSLGQYYSAAASAWFTCLSLVWYCMMIYYNFIKKDPSSNG